MTEGRAGVVNIVESEFVAYAAAGTAAFEVGHIVDRDYKISRVSQGLTTVRLGCESCLLEQFIWTKVCVFSHRTSLEKNLNAYWKLFKS